MNETQHLAAINRYLEDVTGQFYAEQHASEHAYRPALKDLMEVFEDTRAINDPRRSEHGNPDFVFLKKSNQKIIKGYAEAKDIGVSLDKTEKTNQMERYGGYANLFLTDYLEFRFFKNGDKYKTISLGYAKDGVLYKTPENGAQLARELSSFLELPPEKIRNGKRLAQIMGGKARRIRDNVFQYLDESSDSSELDKMYQMMKKMLVHDLTPAKFADMYAQTLVYGLFVARYGDSTPENFSRSEARDLVPASNPFLRHFFDHIVGPNFDTRLGYIVDELCEVFEVSNVNEIVHKHLRIADTVNEAKDPIIHFYEDFLQEYDPAERKRMGAYYTPIPVVKFIVRQVDKILKEEFGIIKGLASNETITHEIETGQDLRADRRTTKPTTQKLIIPRVQILDPAVGTATFLNETIKFIHEEFKGQEGRWPAYVAENLIKRLHGFELMMAPYTIAHLKLGMTLKETGVDTLNDRIGVYLTNTLEEGVPTQGDMFTMFGLAEAVADESRHAAEIKSERPVMVVVGNPPYSGESSNRTKYADGLINKYRVEPGGQYALKERTSKWLGDDYVKFISFAEELITKNGEGIVAYISNNGYIDNPTFRGMRWHLAKTFDKIYILDLHGNSKKKEHALDGTKDENVFDIMQGVGIILAIKTGNKPNNELGEIYHADMFGTRKSKFDALGRSVEFTRVSLSEKMMDFVPRDTTGLSEYMCGVSLENLFSVSGAGISTAHDKFVIGSNKDELVQKFAKFKLSQRDDSLYEKFNVKHKDGWDIKKGWDNLQNVDNIDDFVKPISYRPFDDKHILYENRLVWRSVNKIMQHYLKPNEGLLFTRMTKGKPFTHIFATEKMSEVIFLSPLTGTNAFNAPLYLYHDDGTRTSNFDLTELSALTRNITVEYSPEDILDYIYAVLHSSSYRTKYGEFLKIDFPRVPVPSDDVEFSRHVRLGHQLRELHLMKSQDLSIGEIGYPIVGTNEVEKVTYRDGCVYINETQYFGNVSEIAWNFYIGGYQPAQKWLKDRKGQVLSNDDLDHYEKIITILIETDRIMKEIDNTN